MEVNVELLAMAPPSSTQISITVYPSWIIASKKNVAILTGTLSALVGKPKCFLDLASMISRAMLNLQIDEYRWTKYIQSDVVWVWFWVYPSAQVGLLGAV
eukprot:13890697-Ditylum_brightwellii.AAC.2